jgi:6-pyruvoyl-tetrahydropterin synthase
MFVVKKRLQNAAIAHRLGKGYPNKCLNIHGHEYFFDVEVGTNNLDQYDMAIDFGDIKTICDKWIQSNWDHAVVVSEFDTSFREFLEKENMRHFVFPNNQNSTAENMSKFLAELFFNQLSEEYDIKYLTMSVWETPTSEAKYTVRKGN